MGPFAFYEGKHPVGVLDAAEAENPASLGCGFNRSRPGAEDESVVMVDLEGPVAEVLHLDRLIYLVNSSDLVVDEGQDVVTGLHVLWRLDGQRSPVLDGPAYVIWKPAGGVGYVAGLLVDDDLGFFGKSQLPERIITQELIIKSIVLL